MVYTRLEELSNTGIDGILQYPATGDYYFWLKLLVGIWVIIGLTLYFNQRRRTGQSSFLSAFAVSSMAMISLALAGTLVGILTTEMFLIALGIGMVIIAIWYLRED